MARNKAFHFNTSRRFAASSSAPRPSAYRVHFTKALVCNHITLVSPGWSLLYLDYSALS